MATADWNPLGDAIYRKYELYVMAWQHKVDLSKYFVAAAPYGGPIALTRSDSKYLIRYGGKSDLYIFTSAGRSMSQKAWSSGRLVYMGWSNTEELLCVQDDGTVLGYDMFMNSKRTFGMGTEAKETKVLDCRIFTSFHGTGVAVLTTTYRIFIVTNIDDPRIRRLAEVPGLLAVPSCWEVINVDRNSQALVASESTLYLLDRGGQYQQKDPPMTATVNTYLAMAVSFNNKFLALFTSSGMLWIGSSDLQTVYCEFDTQSQTKPNHLAWCGSTAVLACWDKVLIAVGPNKDWIKYPCDDVVHLVQEVDGVRIISNMTHEFFTKVPVVTVEILRIGSISPGALLYEASREFQKGSQKADEYIRLIKDKLAAAVMNCIEAAGTEYDIPRQKLLLKAASFGKCFLTDYKPEQFVDMCRKLRVLNCVRDHDIGIPLTSQQLDHLTMPVLVDRLVFRKLFPHAIRICQYLAIPDAEGASRILAHWACYKVQQKGESDEVIAQTISNKLGNTPGVSYSEIASKAIEVGRTELAIRLLDHEPKASEQVPLLLQMKKSKLALNKAISSGDTDLVYTVLLCLKETFLPGNFLLFIQPVPMAHSLYLQYCRRQNRQTLEDMFYQGDNFVEGANCHVMSSYDEQRLDGKISQLSSAKEGYIKGKNEFSAKQTEEQIRLLRLQRGYEEQYTKTFVDLSLHQTMYQLSLHGASKQVESLRKEFKVPDRRFWWLRIAALGEAGDWIEMEKFSRTKKSPIGYEPFIDICMQYHNRFEAAKYLSKVLPENRIRCNVQLGKHQDAAMLAYEAKNIEDLQYVLSKCPTSDNSLIENVRSMIEQLSSRK